jgi:hypothetical protein
MRQAALEQRPAERNQRIAISRVAHLDASRNHRAASSAK